MTPDLHARQVALEEAATLVERTSFRGVCSRCYRVGRYDAKRLSLASAIRHLLESESQIDAVGGEAGGEG